MAHLAVTNLEDDDLFELHALPRWWQGSPLTALRARDCQVHDDAITLADELKEFLVVVGEGRPRACHASADTLVSLAKRVWAIIPDEIGSVEVRDTIEAALVPDDLGQLPHERFVALDWVGVPRRYARWHGGTASKGKCEGWKQDGQKGAHRYYLLDLGATPARRGEVAARSPYLHLIMPS